MNAQDATPADGNVVVKTEKANKTVMITVADSGCGMTLEFVQNHLFKLFDSTKGGQDIGIGAYQAREFAHKMGGDLKVDSVKLQGTTESLILPLAYNRSPAAIAFTIMALTEQACAGDLQHNWERSNPQRAVPKPAGYSFLVYCCICGRKSVRWRECYHRLATTPLWQQLGGVGSCKLS